jgi:hypothetical protein
MQLFVCSDCVVVCIVGYLDMVVCGLVTVELVAVIAHVDVRILILSGGLNDGHGMPLLDDI